LYERYFAKIDINNTTINTRVNLILKKYLVRLLDFSLLFLPKNSERYLKKVFSIPQSVKDNASVTIESAKAYTPKSSGSNILARIIVKIKPPNFRTNNEAKLYIEPFAANLERF